ncbi:MAG TPA: STAS/SEC14 domain-containing protein [Chthoniobacterales bacterium]
MPIDLTEIQNGRVLEVRVSGKIVKEDYETFVPAMDRLVRQHGKIQMLMEMHDFHGWTLGAAWEDTKFALHHFHDIERLAIVGETKWQEAMAAFCKPFTKAEVRFFDRKDIDDAREWVIGAGS